MLSLRPDDQPGRVGLAVPDAAGDPVELGEPLGEPDGVLPGVASVTYPLGFGAAASSGHCHGPPLRSGHSRKSRQAPHAAGRTIHCSLATILTASQ